MLKKIKEFWICWEGVFYFSTEKFVIGRTINENELKNLLNDAYFALRFFIGNYAHERGGPAYFYKWHHLKILEKHKDEFKSGLPNPTVLWNDFKKSVENANEKNTKGPVKTILEKLQENGETNLIKVLLQNKSPNGAYDFLVKDVSGVSHKIASLFLRDIQFLFNTWRDEKDGIYYLFPVDRWVEKIAEDFLKSELKGNSKRKARKIVQDLQEKVGFNLDEIIKFNAGAWFIGSHYRDLGYFYGFQSLEEAIQRADPYKVRKLIDTFRKHYNNRNIFPA